jgi:hypothetical protein
MWSSGIDDRGVRSQIIILDALCRDAFGSGIRRHEGVWDEIAPIEAILTPPFMADGSKRLFAGRFGQFAGQHHVAGALCHGTAHNPRYGTNNPWRSSGQASARAAARSRVHGA